MKTYKRINAVKTTVAIIKYLSDQREPVSGADAAADLERSYPTVMCHLVTLEDAGIVRQIGDHWELGDAMALMWARKKAALQSARDRIDRTLTALGE